jgi:hypothetical protein
VGVHAIDPVSTAWPKIGTSLFKNGHGPKGRWYFRYLEPGPFFAKCGTQVPFSFNGEFQYKIYIWNFNKKCRQLGGRGRRWCTLHARTPFRRWLMSKASTKCMELRNEFIKEPLGGTSSHKSLHVAYNDYGISLCYLLVTPL